MEGLNKIFSSVINVDIDITLPTTNEVHNRVRMHGLSWNTWDFLFIFEDKNDETDAVTLDRFD